VIDAVSSVLPAMSRHAVWHLEDLRCHRINEPGKCNTGSVLSFLSGVQVCALELLACSSRANACLRRREDGQRSDAEGNVTDRKRKKKRKENPDATRKWKYRIGIDSEFELHFSSKLGCCIGDRG